MNDHPTIKQEKQRTASAAPEQPASDSHPWPEPSTTTTTTRIKRSPSPASSSEIVLTGFESKATKRLKVTQQAAKDAVVIEESMAATGCSGTRDDHESIVRDQQPAQTSYARKEEDIIVEDQLPTTPTAARQEEVVIEAEQSPVTPAPAQREEISGNVQDSSPAESGEGKTRFTTPRKTFKTSTRKPKSPVRHKHRIDGRWVTCPHASPREGCGQAYYFG